MIVFKFVTTSSAELIGSAHRTEAGSAASGELVVALWAEVEITLNVSPAGWASGDRRRAEEEVEDGTDSPWHDEAYEHPKPRTHCPPGSILADVADHKDVKRGEEPPRDVEIGAKTERCNVVLRSWENDPEVVLDKDEDNARDDDRPNGDQPGVFMRIDGFWFAHTLCPRWGGNATIGAALILLN